MKGRSGQVALYLVLVLVAIAVLMLMNVGVFLSVRSKNRMMNAADEAALAAAKRQGALLNEIGKMNVEHLRAAIANQAWPRLEEQRDLVFLGPLEAMVDCGRTVADWGFGGGGRSDLSRALARHVGEISDEYVANPDLYPEYRRNQWLDYAARLSAVLAAGVNVSPGCIESANAWSQAPLLSRAFYDAIAARAWCWFSLGGRERYLDCDSKSMPRPEFGEAGVQENSEIFPLHVTFKSWKDSPWAEEMNAAGEFSERWTNFVCQVTGCSREQVAQSALIADDSQLWAFYDDRWGSWSRTFNPDRYPIAGSVRPEYDVAGCFASCLMVGDVIQLLDGDDVSARCLEVTAAAKPLGTVIGLDDGQVAPVTAYNSFIAASRPGERIFTEAQLVLMGSVPQGASIDLSPQWYDHVKDHLPGYFNSGLCTGGCYYCAQLELWENPAFRGSAKVWLQNHRGECTVKGDEGMVGGYDCAH